MSSPVDPETLPYRPCAGIALFNAEGLVWIGQRIDVPDDTEGHGVWWQLPQGGIDEGEEPLVAARRELEEETSVRSISFLAESDWFTYDLPPELVGIAWKGRYRGQRIKFFAFRFAGNEAEIDVTVPGHSQEFSAWRWEHLERLPDLIVSFKRHVYEGVVDAFRDIANNTATSR